MNYKFLSEELLNISRLRKELREYFFEMEDLLVKYGGKKASGLWHELHTKVYELDTILNNEGEEE